MSFGWVHLNKDRNLVLFHRVEKKITLDGNTSWAPSDKNLPLWFSDSSLLEFDVTPQSRNRLVRLREETDKIDVILVLILEIEKQMHNGMLPSCNCW